MNTSSFEVLQVICNLQQFHCQIDGVSQSLPYHSYDLHGAERFSVVMNGLKLQFKSAFGLVVQLSMSDKWTIIIRAPADAAGLVDGLCRNFDGSASDDYVLPNSQDVTDDPNRDTIIGDYFYIQDPEDIEYFVGKQANRLSTRSTNPND